MSETSDESKPNNKEMALYALGVWLDNRRKKILNAESKYLPINAQIIERERQYVRLLDDYLYLYELINHEETSNDVQS